MQCVEVSDGEENAHSVQDNEMFMECYGVENQNDHKTDDSEMYMECDGDDNDHQSYDDETCMYWKLLWTAWADLVACREVAALKEALLYIRTTFREEMTAFTIRIMVEYCMCDKTDPSW